MVDGQLVLPAGYSSESGETVILVYETPEGQQFMTEDGQPIVFQQEDEDGQAILDPQQIAAQLQGGAQVSRRVKESSSLQTSASTNSYPFLPYI